MRDDEYTWGIAKIYLYTFFLLAFLWVVSYSSYIELGVNLLILLAIVWRLYEKRKSLFGGVE